MNEMIDTEKIRLAMVLHEIEEERVAGLLGDGEAQEHRIAAALDFYSVDEEGYRRPDFYRLNEALISGEAPIELCNIEYDDDNGKVCDCEGCKERRGW